MALIHQLAQWLGLSDIESRSSLENPQTPLSYPAEWLLDIFNGGRTDSGLRVSELTALQVSTVLACVNIIANAVSSSPLNVYERISRDGRVGKKIAYTHALFDLLNNEPNDEMSSPDWRQTLMCHALLWGNHYSEIQRSRDDNAILGIWPHNPTRVRVVRAAESFEAKGEEYPAGTLVYEITEPIWGTIVSPSDSVDDKLLKPRIVLAEDVIHLHGLSLDGRIGQDTVNLARQAIGLALATEKYGAKFFGNNARPAGILSTPGTLADKAKENLKRSWNEAHGGENTHKTAVLEQGVVFTKIASTPEEAQNIETRNFQRLEICNIFGVPARMLEGGDGKAASKATAETTGQEFLTFTVGPWMNKLEHELKRKLFPKMGRSSGKYFPGFDTRHLIYPDAASRATLYGAGKQWGFLSTNDIRELEGLNAIDGPAGDMLWRPTTMTDSSLPATTPAAPVAPEPEVKP
jgi:HK97 family phage portal protein